MKQNNIFMRRGFALFLSLVMCLGLLQVPVFAADGDDGASETGTVDKTDEAGEANSPTATDNAGNSNEASEPREANDYVYVYINVTNKAEDPPAMP